MKNKKGKFVFRDKEFKDFKSMKTDAYFKMSIETKESGYFIVDDEVWIEYEFDKKERRIVCKKVYDYDEKARMDWNSKQLKIW